MSDILKRDKFAARASDEIRRMVVGWLKTKRGLRPDTAEATA